MSAKLSRTGMPAMTEGGDGDPDGAGPFKKRTLAIIIGVALASLIATVVLTVVGTDSEEQSAGVDTFSVSVLGHRGLAELLTELDIPVVISRSDSASKARNGLLIIAEPAITDEASRLRLQQMIEDAPRVLVVLPKWYGQSERGRAWVNEADYIPEAEVRPILEVLTTVPASLVRLPASTPLEDGYDANRIVKAPKPRILEPQLLKADDTTPYVHVAGDIDTMLVTDLGVAPGTRVVLSDPDVINNWGLRDPDNARFTVALIDELRDGGPVVIDETLHGYARRPSLVRTLTTFPLVLATIQVLLVALLGVWAAMVRFGPKNATPPPFAPGKDFLIRNTAALLHYGGHHAEALRRYLASSVTDVKHQLHAPSLVPAQLTAWLERVRLHRGGTISLVDLERHVQDAKTPERFLEVADQIYRWRMEMTDGSQYRS